MQNTSIQKFLNREKELSILINLIESSSSEFIVVYGRRRIGKTMLIRELEKNVEVYIVYIVGRRETEKLLLERLGRVCARVFGDEFLVHGGFSTWDQFFRYIASKAKRDPVILVFDEFPDMVYSSPQLPSVLREYWDNLFVNRLLKIIVIGSSISMMKKLLMSRESILYGRRTFELKVKPLDIVNTSLFLKGRSFNDIIRYYAVVGGTPAYLEIASRYSIRELIDYSITKGSILYEDGFTVVSSEVEEPRIHYAVLSMLSKGYRRLGAIANRLGVRLNILHKYMGLLKLLDIVCERRNLIGKGRYYYIADPYHSWWSIGVYENIDLLEKGIKKSVYNKLLEELDNIVSVTTIPIITEQLLHYTLPQGNLENAGFILHKDIEFDYVLKYGDKYVIVESKWSDLSSREAERIAYSALGKAYALKLNNPKIIVVARTIDNREEYYSSNKNYVLTTFNTLYKYSTIHNQKYLIE